MTSNKNKKPLVLKQRIHEKCGKPLILVPAPIGSNGELQLFCPNPDCREVVDEKPALHDFELPIIKSDPQEMSKDEKREMRHIEDPRLLLKGNIPRIRKGRKGDFCVITYYDNKNTMERLHDLKKDDPIRQKYQKDYCCEILDEEQVKSYKKLDLTKVDPYGSDEKYQEAVKGWQDLHIRMIKHHNKNNPNFTINEEEERKKALKPLRIVPNTRTEYKHCKHCGINIQVNKFEYQMKKIHEQEQEQEPKDRETWCDDSGRWWESRTIYEGRTTKITYITPEELYKEEMQKEKNEELERQRRYEDMMFKNELSPLLDGVFNVGRLGPSKFKSRSMPNTIARKLTDEPGKTDPINKDDPYKKLQAREIKDFRCLCCNQLTAKGLTQFKKRDKK